MCDIRALGCELEAFNWSQTSIIAQEMDYEDLALERCCHNAGLLF